MNDSDCEDPNDILIMGTAYTPSYDDCNDTTLFTADQMTSEFANNMKNLPVYIEHDNSIQVGTIKEAYIDEKRRLKTILHIAGNRMVNEKLPATLHRDPEYQRRFFNDLSLGNDIGLVKENDRVCVKSNIPSEVSVVKNGDRPETHIDDYWIVPKTQNVDDFFKEKIEPNIIRFN